MAYDPNAPTEKRSGGPSWVVLWIAVAIVAVIIAAVVWWGWAATTDGVEDEDGAFRVQTGQPVGLAIDGVKLVVAA